MRRHVAAPTTADAMHHDACTNVSGDVPVARAIAQPATSNAEAHSEVRTYQPCCAETGSAAAADQKPNGANQANSQSIVKNIAARELDGATD